MPSSTNTLRRCRSRVRALGDGWAPITGFVSPARARRATCAS
jgi:hypothetical protein